MSSTMTWSRLTVPEAPMDVARSGWETAVFGRGIVIVVTNLIIMMIIILFLFCIIIINSCVSPGISLRIGPLVVLIDQHHPLTDPVHPRAERWVLNISFWQFGDFVTFLSLFDLQHLLIRVDHLCGKKSSIVEPIFIWFCFHPSEPEQHDHLSFFSSSTIIIVGL